MEKLAASVPRCSASAPRLTSITAATPERVGFEPAIASKALAPVVERIANFLQGALAKRDPSLAPPPEARGAKRATKPLRRRQRTAPGAFATLADVDAALGAALGYFAASEPSSPALLLIGQARETLGKNLYEVMKLLAPGHADAARVFVGPDGAFTVPVSGLSSAPGAEFARADAEPAASRAAALAPHRRRREPFAARRAVEPGALPARSRPRARLARLSQPAARRIARGRSRRDEERALNRYLPASVRNVVQSGESSVSISAKLTACNPRRQQSEMPKTLNLTRSTHIETAPCSTSTASMSVA